MTHLTAQAFVRTLGDIEAMKRDAWAGYVTDYILAVDADPADARTRYQRKMEAIAAIDAATKGE